MSAIELACTSLGLGLFVGAVFFGGLWLTVTRGISARQAQLWFCISLLLRLSIAAAGFCAVAARDWQALVLCCVGFLAARTAFMRISAHSCTASHAP